MTDALFIPGRVYIARNSRRENCGLWRCVKRTDSFVTFQKGTKTIRRKPIKTITEGVVVEEGRPWKGLMIGRQWLVSYDYKSN